MFYTVYQITNNISGKRYISVHKTLDVNDAYMGSGTQIKRAIAKHGVGNFTKTILASFDNAPDMFALESELVTEQFIRDKSTYNIVIGGDRPLTYYNDNVDTYTTRETRSNWARVGRQTMIDNGHALSGTKRKQWLMTNDVDFYNRMCQISKDTASRHVLGKKHSQESLNKMKASRVGRQTGKTNNNFGKCWIYSPKQ